MEDLAKWKAQEEQREKREALVIGTIRERERERESGFDLWDPLLVTSASLLVTSAILVVTKCF